MVDVNTLTQWKQDLVKDIRFFDYRDDLDLNDGNIHNCPNITNSIVVRHPLTGVVQTMSPGNIEHIAASFNRVKDTAKCILEIGVDANIGETDMTSSKFFITNKHDRTVYVGVDLNPKSYLNNTEKNIHTLQTNSGNIDEIIAFVRSLGIETIDYLFIDGWHSINQVMIEWEYTKWLSPGGVVGFHDTKSHPGPYLFTHHLDTTKWHVIPDACAADSNDYGVGFAWRK